MEALGDGFSVFGHALWGVCVDAIRRPGLGVCGVQFGVTPEALMLVKINTRGIR